jgi:hypothetical protein
MTTKADSRLLDQQEIQHKLNLIGYGRPFKIIFIKADGSQRLVTQAMMEKPKAPHKNGDKVAVMSVDEGKYVSFYTDKVLYLEEF